MDLWMRNISPGIYYYLPFHACRQPAPKEVTDLKYLCKMCIVQKLTVKRMPFGIKQLGLPNPLIRYLTKLTTLQFDEIERAPFGDVFGLNFFHRALTYKVHCLYDDNHYLATHACWSEEDSWHQKDDVHKWVQLQHVNMMRIYAFVEDVVTGNLFYLFDFPELCLKQLSLVLAKKNEALPEAFIWRLIADLGSAVQNILRNGIHYPPFGLHNAFVVGEKLVLENGVTRKVWQSGSCETLEGCELKEPEEQAVWCLRQMVNKLTEHHSNSEYSDSLNDVLKEMTNGKSLHDIVLVAKSSVKQSHVDSFSIASFIQFLQRTISTGTQSQH